MMSAVAMAWPASQSWNQVAVCRTTLWTADVFSSLRPIRMTVAEALLTIHGGTLVTMNARRDVLAPATLAVTDDGVVSEIGATVAPRGRVIDARGKIVLPGFVQTHVHLCQTLYRNRADDLALLDW